MVHVVGELPFDTYFLRLFMESETVFTVTVGYCLLQPGIQPDYVVGDVTKLVMRKRFGIEDAFSPLCTFGKTVEPRCDARRAG